MNYYIVPGLKFRQVKVLNSNNIVQSVCDCFGLSLNDLQKKRRNRDLVTARHLCYYFLRKYTDSTLKEIGGYFNHDHTTVLHGRDKVDDFIKIKDSVTLSNIYKIEGLLDEITRPIYS